MLQYLLKATGTVLSVAGQYQAMRAMESQARYQAQLARYQAQWAMRRAQAAEIDARRERDQILGAARAAVGASGVSVDVGTAAYLTEDIAMISEIDILRIRQNAAAEVWGYEASEDQARLSASVARDAGILGMGTSVVTGMTDLYRYRQT